MRRMTVYALACFAGLLSPVAVFGQAAATASPLAAEAQGRYAQVKGFITKAAENMPAENYSYKPTPDIRTFARVVNHVTEAQFRACGALNGTSEAKPAPPETADKATIVDALKASFAECDKAFGTLSDSNVTEMVQLGSAKHSRIGIAWGTVTHDTEQYATLALYMRLKGLVPPSSEK
ncbi:DinB family protein [Alloacidobacterium sp.]|uniref:DinB family protein n=1 Tax=Alloacidobacterium sp. TaxID=2951999 RepID=UPI002D564E3F|nr:DinB family protein [Alloacidobacterium sp.]HYK37148.1 DinB family protein [Alloacidobacterium sp.]